MDDVERKSVDSAFSDRICELFRTLCLSMAGAAHGHDAAINVFRDGLNAARAARAAATELVEK